MKTCIGITVFICLLIFPAYGFDNKANLTSPYSTGRFENSNTSAPWNHPLHQDDPIAPWNDQLHKDDLNAPWNKPYSSKEETNRYLEEKNITIHDFYWK